MSVLHAGLLSSRSVVLLIADSHCTNAAGMGWTECSVAVSNQMTWCFIPGESISGLTRNPLGGGIGGHADSNQLPSLTQRAA